MFCSDQSFFFSFFLKSVFTFPQSVNNKQVIVGARTVWGEKSETLQYGYAGAM